MYMPSSVLVLPQGHNDKSLILNNSVKQRRKAHTFRHLVCLLSIYMTQVLFWLLGTQQSMNSTKSVSFYSFLGGENKQMHT